MDFPKRFCTVDGGYTVLSLRIITISLGLKTCDVTLLLVTAKPRKWFVFLLSLLCFSNNSPLIEMKNVYFIILLAE